MLHPLSRGSWPAQYSQERAKISVLFWSGLAAAVIPLSIAFYWVIFWLLPEAEGAYLRVSVLACAVFLGLFWYRAPISHAEANLVKTLGLAAVILLIPETMTTHGPSGWLKTLVLFTVCCFIARGLRHPPTARIFGYALLTGGIILMVFIVYTYVHNLGFVVPTYKATREFKGIEEHAGIPLNGIAFTEVLSYVAGLCLIRSNWFLICIGVPLFATSSIFTGSRAPLVMLGVTLFVLLCINGLRNKSLLLRFATALFAGATLFGGVALVVATPDQDLTSATEGRWHLWSVGLRKFSERPVFGYGYETWRDDLVSRLPGEYDLTYALAAGLGGGYHNEYISLLAEEGLLGVAAAGLIIWLLLRSSWLLSFRSWQVLHTKQWPLFASLFLLFRANFEVPGLFGYGQDPVDYLAYVLLAIVVSRFSVEEDAARQVARIGHAA